MSARQIPTLVAAAIAALEGRHHDYKMLPLYNALIAYRDEGHPIGDFLRSLLSNDLVEAIGRADNQNLWLLPVYVAFLYNQFPSTAWGSSERVAAWLVEHDARRRAAAEVAT